MVKSKKRTWQNIGITVLGIVICGLIVLVIFLLTSEKRTETTTTKTTNISGLTCEKRGNDNKYFNKEQVVTSGEHKIQANFGGDGLIDLMYMYEGSYTEGTDLAHVKDVAEANFNLEYGNEYIYNDNAWRASFMVDKTKQTVKMSLYAEENSLDSNVAEVFQLKKDQTFPKTIEAMKTAYEDAGYTCTNS